MPEASAPQSDARRSGAPKLGITLPSFRENVEPSLAVAAAAEAHGIDGVFAYDHLFRRGPKGERRPAIEMLVMLGAIAAATERVVLGSLVARASLRPPATLANGLDTVARIAGPERLAIAVGAGDGESKEENESFGLGFGSVEDRLAMLRDTVDTLRDRGYPVWIGGTDPAVREMAAAHADGWNRWGGPIDKFAAQVVGVREAAARQPFTLSWGGLVVLADSDAEAAAKAERLGIDNARRPAGARVVVGGPDAVADALRPFVEAGAEWLMAGPIDSSDPDNCRILGDEVAPRLR
jgi:alkanesulfonate monooxygenase SsuD/methylene tetrahydromethanopterin reductase-like flavin-dependent oxidoreductase (luciferase family)